MVSHFLEWHGIPKALLTGSNEHLEGGLLVAGKPQVRVELCGPSVQQDEKPKACFTGSMPSGWSNMFGVCDTRSWLAKNAAQVQNLFALAKSVFLSGLPTKRVTFH